MFVLVQRTWRRFWPFGLAKTATERSYEELLLACQDGIILADEAGVIVGCNPAVERLFGWTPQELVGHSLHRLMPERFQAAHDAALAQARTTRRLGMVGQPRSLIAQHRENREFPVEVTLTAWAATRTAPLSFGAIIRDATVQETLKATLRQQNDLLQEQLTVMSAEMDKLKGTLVSYTKPRVIQRLDEAILKLQSWLKQQMDADAFWEWREERNGSEEHHPD